MVKQYEICIPVMLREHDPARALDDTSGMTTQSVWIGVHAKDEDDAIDQIARMLAGMDGEDAERH